MWYMLMILGSILILFGCILWRAKETGFLQKLIPKNVNKKKYQKFMGILSIICGLFWLILGVLFLLFDIPLITPFMVLSVYIAFVIYGEVNLRREYRNGI